MDQAGIVVLFILIAIVCIAYSFTRYSKAYTMLDDWARASGYRLVSAERKTFFRGSFFFRTSKSQLVYRITVEGPDGTQYTGYARVGGWFMGLLSDQVDVRWDS